MAQHTFQLESKAAQIYETQKVPAMFRPLAEATLREVPLYEDDHVLDVACGTGIIARLAGEKVGNSGRVVGVDLNRGMIEVARASSDAQRNIFEWCQADVTALPFADDIFTIAYCQQGLQFFPDKAAALDEIQKVLRPDGRIILTVWSAASPLFIALAESLKIHVSAEIAARSLAPFAFRDEEIIRALLVDAGFVDVTLQKLTIERVIGPANESIPNEIAGNPVGPDVASRGEKVLDQIVKEVGKALESYQRHDGFAIPQDTHLFQARVR